MKNNFQGITNLFIYYEQFRGDGSENKKKEKTHLNQKYSQSLQKKKRGSTFNVQYLTNKNYFFLQIITVLPLSIVRLIFFLNCRNRSTVRNREIIYDSMTVTVQ